MNIKNFLAIMKVLQRLNNLRRWTEFTTEGKYNEISKQALNCMICFVLAKEVENSGTPINWNRFPIIAIYRAFQKAYVNYDIPEHILKEICDLGNIPFKKVFGEITDSIICELTDNDFTNSLKTGCETHEEKIYKAATKIATFLELRELQKHINGDYSSKYEEILKSMGEFFEDIPMFAEVCDSNGNYFKLFEVISSKLRNQNRWSAYSYIINCSVLGHLFDTAVFAYLMALEKGETENIATKCFFMGIFHDVPEAFTRDIPSPIKDRIPGFRKLTEAYELKKMEENVYALVSEETKKALKNVMFEEDGNANLKGLMKGADYMSAVSEIWRQIKAGTRDESFLDAIENHIKKFNEGTADLSKTAKEVLLIIIEDVSRLKL